MKDPEFHTFMIITDDNRVSPLWILINLTILLLGGSKVLLAIDSMDTIPVCVSVCVTLWEIV